MTISSERIHETPESSLRKKYFLKWENLRVCVCFEWRCTNSCNNTTFGTFPHSNRIDEVLWVKPNIIMTAVNDGELPNVEGCMPLGYIYHHRPERSMAGWSNWEIRVSIKQFQQLAWFRVIELKVKYAWTQEDLTIYKLRCGLKISLQK